MNIFTNEEIKKLFINILICVSVFVLISVTFMICDIQNIVMYMFIAFLCMSGIICIICYRYFSRQHKIMENAISQISKYMYGDTTINLDCNSEGELYKLFHQINSLVSILNSRAENEKESKKFLKNIISDISHQLKTPLAALNIYNGIIKEEAKDIPDIQKFSILSEQELDRIETLVQNLLKVAKMDAGMIVPKKAMENVAALAENVREHFLFRAEQEGKEIRLLGNPDTEFPCDRIWMTEAIGNLVKNALDHTQEGGIIYIKWKAFTNMVQIRVEDNGSGIHPEDLYYIFKRFYRSRFSQDTKGIGLGLTLAKAIVEAHNGTIEAGSSLGLGTSFTMNFNYSEKNRFYGNSQK